MIIDLFPILMMAFLGAAGATAIELFRKRWRTARYWLVATLLVAATFFWLLRSWGEAIEVANRFKAAAATQPAPPPPVKLVWDLSQNNRIERVGWPATIKSDVWIIDGPGTIRLKVRGGAEHEVKIRSAIVGSDSGRVKNVRLILERGTIDTVYADAMKLAADWQIADTKDIQVFKDTRAFKVNHGGDGVYQVNDYEAVQPKSIEIRESFDSASGKPFLTILAMGFKQDFDAPTLPSP